MGNRFDDLDHFLPPQPAPSTRAPAGEASEPIPRARPRGSRRRILGIARATVACALVAATLLSMAWAARLVPSLRGDTAEPERSTVDISLGAGSAGDLGRARQVAPSASRRRARDVPRRTPRRVRRRLPLVTGAAVAQPIPVRRQTSALPEGTEPSKPVGGRQQEYRAPSRPSEPAPPQTPLFHCISGPGNEHYMTIDRARAGQLSDPRSGWRCDVVGRVYQDDGEGRSPIELDDGRAFVLTERVPTEPATDLIALYRHWAGYDWYYSDAEADGGLVGFVGA